ncbi:MAG: endonuclease/exonuclease/phosphatase family protein [Bacteroidota bacterium]
MKFLKKLVLPVMKAATVLLLFLYIPALFVYHISPKQWWPIGILSIGFPYLWLILVLCVAVGFFLHRKAGFILLCLLLAGLPIMKQVFAFNVSRPFATQKQLKQIRIMQWNCRGLPGFQPKGVYEDRRNVVNFIRKYQPDIICIQDFSETVATNVYSNIHLMQDTLGYKYFLFTQHYKTNNPGWKDGVGIAIFSKYPIADSGRLHYPGKMHPESILWASVNIAGKFLRVATTHFQSMHLTRTGTTPLEKELWEDRKAIIYGSTLDKLQYFQNYHITQANFLRSFLDTSSGPLIFTGDLNSVPSSYTYKVSKGQLTDAFLVNGSGFGRTYDSRQPALRIDYIFHNQQISAHQIKLFRTTFSDHDPLIIDCSIR